MNTGKFKVLSFFVVLAIAAVSCEKDVFTGVVENEKYESGTIFVTSTPPGARIFINNRFMGAYTPDSIKWIDVGENKVTLKKDLFLDVNINTFVVDKNTSTVSYNYYKDYKQYGNINFGTSPDGSKIYLNDSLLNKFTPYFMSGVFPGYYKVKFAYPEHRMDSLIVTVKAGESSQAYIALDDTSKWVVYNVKNSPALLSDIYSCSATDKNDIKWFGTYDRGVVRFDEKKMSLFHKENSPLPGNQVTSLLVDNNNRVWIGLKEGLVVYDGHTFVDYTSNLPGMYVVDLVIDQQFNIWIATADGIVRYSNGSWFTFNMLNSGFPEKLISSIAAAPNGDIWATTHSKSILHYSNNKWRVILTSSFLEDADGTADMKAIQVDKDGVVWVAHSIQKESNPLKLFLTSIKNGVIVSREYMKYAGSEVVNNIYVDKNNRKWICTDFGLITFQDNPENIKRYITFNSRLPSNRVDDVIMDGKENLWILTRGGGFVKVKKGYY